MTSSSIVTQSLLAVALLSVAMVEAAPLESTKSAAKNTKTVSGSKTKAYVPTPKTLRRGKRNVILEEIPDDSGSLGTEEDILREQLADLTDDQLAVLAEIVQNEIDQYNPETTGIEAYEIVELPEYLTQPIEYMPRDRRSVPVFEAFDENELPEEFEENQEVIFVPEEALLEAAAEEQDELELRQRIAEIATILNERATRRLRFF
uniref:Fibrous sheath-interacting protein 1 n=1 Tax=Caenorhabditis tropicalis TaxID=1561998 RepID=A0A1I7T856_9PELO